MKKILVVDDDPDMLGLVKAILMGKGYITETLSEWENVYNTVRAFQPHVIFLDVNLNGVDGRILCQSLKSTEDTKHIPVVMFSALTRVENEVMEYGADGFLPKPFLIDQLLGKVKGCLKGVSENHTKAEVEIPL